MVQVPEGEDKRQILTEANEPNVLNDCLVAKLLIDEALVGLEVSLNYMIIVVEPFELLPAGVTLWLVGLEHRVADEHVEAGHLVVANEVDARVVVFNLLQVVLRPVASMLSLR